MSFQELPEELFEKVLSYLDFKTVQKTCTLVCHGWRELIQDSSILSGEMALKLTENDAATWDDESKNFVYKSGKEMEIKTVLSNWRKLHTLRIPCNMPGIDLSIYPHLRKVVVISPLAWHPNLQVKKLSWVELSKICYNPKNEPYAGGFFSDYHHLSPYPEDVIELKLLLNDANIHHYNSSHPNCSKICPFEMSLEQSLSKMKNLETLVIQWNLTNLCFVRSLQSLQFIQFKPALQG